MPNKSVERRLTAILAADVAGYSRLVAAHEPWALAQFSGHLHELIEPHIAEHGGRIIKTTGDGVLAAYGSAVSALESALEIQAGMGQRNQALPPERRLEFRIGIHVADVVIEGGDILGDGVNVAARLEGLAEPGGICVSGRVFEDTQGRVQVSFESLGEQRLKNIPRPVRAFRVRAADVGEEAVPAALPLPAKPSIAVLPLQNMSGDPEQEYFADAISEDIITALSRWRWFFVISRNSSFVYKGRPTDPQRIGRELGVGYVLEGSVRKAGPRVRIAVQLIETANASSVWAETYDRELVDIFDLQDEITERVVVAIEPAMLHSESTRVARKALSDITAFECFQRGMWHFNKISEDGYRVALSLFRRAIDRDPELSLGYVGLARTLYAGVIYGWADDPTRDMNEAYGAARKAISLDPRDAYGYFAASGASLFLGRHGEALEEARKAVELNPNFAFGHFRLGQVLTFIGRSEEAIAPIERSLRHSPYDPQYAAMLRGLAFAYYHAGDYAEAARQARAALDRGDTGAVGILAASLARSGLIEEARQALGPERLDRGIFIPDRLAPYARPEDRERYFEGLKLAGVEGPVGVR